MVLLWASLAWMRAVITPQGKQNRTTKSTADLLKFSHFLCLIQRESEGWILTDRGGVGDGGG